MNTTSKAVTEASMLLRTASGRRTANNTCRVAKKQASRQYSSSTSRLSGGTPLSGGYTGSLLLGSCFLAGGASLYVLKPTRPTLAETPPPKSSSQSSESDSSGPKADDVFVPIKDDYQAVYDTIAEKLIEEDDYDDGSYAPVLLRLGWHSSGTYDAATNTGGSNGATMRFPPEGKLPPNSGLRHARDFLEPVKAQYPWISYSDLWTLGAVCAVQEMSGPSIPWRPGRKDKDISYCAPDGRLPIASKGADHVRAIYNRMGFNDQEIVALIGAHAVGRCHTDRSGFEGPWTFSPITFTNDFYRLLLDEEWNERDWNGPRQFQNKSSKTLVMLPTDYCLVEDGEFKKYVEKYAADQDVFFDDFSKVMVKLFELGVPFDGNQQRMEFDRTE